MASLDSTCQQVLNVFKKIDPQAAILPGIGLPSQNNGVCTLTHTWGDGSKMQIQGYTSNSPLANNALYSFERTPSGAWINLYEILVPDVPGSPGQSSAAQVYVQALGQQGLDVAGVHFHWFASNPPMSAIHHQKIGSMDPVDFANRTYNALLAAKLQNQRIGMGSMKHNGTSSTNNQPYMPPSTYNNNNQGGSYANQGAQYNGMQYDVGGYWTQSMMYPAGQYQYQ